MQIIVQFTPEVALVLRGELKTSSADAVKTVLARFGLNAAPLFRRHSTGEPATFFSVHTPDSQSAHEIVAELIKLSEVQAAYIKSGAVPPGHGA
jgi:hypothetical protein